MIQRHIRAMAILLFVGAIGSSATASAPLPEQQGQVMQSWFNALRSGNTVVLAALLGPQERARTEALLKNPNYGQFLRERYRDATFKITGHGIQSDGASFVDVAIILDEQETVFERYVFDATADKRLHIDRIEVP